MSRKTKPTPTKRRRTPPLQVILSEEWTLRLEVMAKADGSSKSAFMRGLLARQWPEFEARVNGGGRA